MEVLLPTRFSSIFFDKYYKKKFDFELNLKKITQQIFSQFCLVLEEKLKLGYNISFEEFLLG